MPETHVNMYGGSPLNRLSWLRSSQSFLNAVIALPETRWLLFNFGQPLSISAPNTSTTSERSFTYLTTNDIKQLLGPDPYFGQGQNPGQLVPNTQGAHSPTEAARHLHAPVVFLGLHEPDDGSAVALPTSDFKDPVLAVAKLKGTPYFALDVAELPLTEEQIRVTLESILAKDGKTFIWSEPRSLMTTLDPFTAAIFASARSLVDWNLRNKFCAGCGSPTYSMWGGWKISCRTLLPWADNTGRKPCPTVKGLHNFTHPRTDAVVIMIAIDETGEKVLLGRGRRFPGKFYSALAGFIEPGESFEDAVAREMWEESGVHVWNIKYHSGQPWPYPANLMVGFYARADATKPIRVDLDNELVDARWFSRDEVRAVLDHRAGTKFDKADFKTLNEIVDGRPNTDKTSAESAAHALTPSEGGAAKKLEQPTEAQGDEPPFRLPPKTAIAGMLIRDWVDGKIGFFDQGNSSNLRKGNL